MYFCGPLYMDEQRQDDQQHCADTRCSPEDQTEAMGDREG